MDKMRQDDVSIEDGESLSDKFKKAESIVSGLVDGTGLTGKEKVEECVKLLKSIKSAVERMDLISSNETIDDVPTSSLQYLTVDAYLAVAVENIAAPIENRESLLQESQKLYNEFLFVSDVFGFNPLPSGTFRKDDDEALSLVKDAQIRQRKLDVLSMEDDLKGSIKRLQLEAARSDDESVQRELATKKLQLWCIYSISNLEQISRELKMLEHRRSIQSSSFPHSNVQHKQQPLKTFVIPRVEESKKVFGAGYPSVPKQTVNEWYDNMVSTGRFPGPSEQSQTVQASKPKPKPDGDSEDEDEDKKLDDEEERQNRIAKDDYLDSHRRGWGNTYGKG